MNGNEYSSYSARLEAKRERIIEMNYGKADSERVGLVRVVSTVLRIGRNQPCPCGSGLKYKRCCL